MKTPLVKYLRNKKVKTTDSNNFVRWKLYGEPAQRAIFTNSAESLSPHPGIGHSSFVVTLNSDRFVPGDIIVPEVSRGNRLRVVDKIPTFLDNEVMYRVELMTNNSERYVPREYISEGVFVERLGSSWSYSYPQEFKSMEEWDAVKILSKNRYRERRNYR